MLTDFNEPHTPVTTALPAKSQIAQGEYLAMTSSRGLLALRYLAFALAISTVCSLGPARAEDAPKNGGPTRSPPGAAVYFVDVKDGQTVPSNLVVHFGLTNIGVAPAGTDHPNSGHHHLLIDTELPPL